MDTFGHGQSQAFKGPGAVANDLIGIKRVSEMFLHLQMKLNTRGLLSFSKDKNLKE
jgi:hypothetical protein